MRGQRDESHGVELHLDNRQVFLLFFASAVILSLVFTLGVVVGKRAERQVVPEPGADPLTLLDQVGGKGEKADEDLSFHEALGTPPKPAVVEADAGPENRSDEVEPPPGQKQEPKPAAMPAVLAKAAPKKAEPGEKPESKKQKPKEAVKKTVVAAKKGKAKKTVEPAKSPEDGVGTYSLQLSAFQDRHEARLFMKKLRESGLEPYMVATTIPGRGVWYRVRLGRYKTWDEALAAKQEFERTQKIIAYVAKN